jgi:hypothetical protein
MLLGSLPKPGTSGHFCPEAFVCVTVAIVLFLFFPPVRQAEQMIDIRFDCTASRISRWADRYSGKAPFSCQIAPGAIF